MGIHMLGVLGLVGFHAATVGVGIWVTMIKKIKGGQNAMILANRSIGLFLGIFSLVGTCVGDTILNGTADSMFSKGLAWCQVPIGYGLSLLFGALLFAKPMRKAEYVTMLDPLQHHYGARVGGLMFLPAFCGDLFRCASLLKALGLSLSIVAGIEPSLGVCSMILAAATYKISGGMYSMVWTDVLQLVCVAFGLSISTPYAAVHPAVSFERSSASKNWMGDIKTHDLGEWLDTMLLAIFGRIPWQGYFQRILSIKSANQARTLSIASMFGCLSLAVPSAMIGAVARATDWPLIDTYNKTMGLDNGSAVMPLVLRYLTPQWVSVAGLVGISAGVMASADTSILGISSMFSRNVYKLTLRPKATERELDWILRISVAIVSFLSATVALSVSSVNYLAYLCSDFMYVVLFPQLLSVIHWPTLVDSYGCIAGYIVGTVVRISGGEKDLGIPAFVEYPFYDSRTHTQKFPFRSAAMLSAIFAQLIVSFFTRNLLGGGYLPRCCDILNVYAPGNTKNLNGVVQSSSGAALIDNTMNDASPGHLSDAPTLSSNRTDYDGSSTDTQLQQHQPPHQQPTIRCDMINVLCEPKSLICNNSHKMNQNLQGPQNLRESMSPKQTATIASRPGQALHHPTIINNPVAPGQILGVKNMNFTSGHMTDCIGPPPPRILSPSTATSMSMPYAKVPTTIITNGRLEGEKIGADRSNMELNLNLTDGSAIIKKNIKGVKLIGMEGGTLRRTSLQGTFSPTPSVEMVNIFDRRQSSSSFGPSSLSPIPGVEACKTHGTAISGQGGNEHCRIKRGIVRHHSFNDTGDRTLTTLARQPNYPSMPLRPEDCRVNQRKDGPQPKKACSQINRYPTSMEEKCLLEADGRVMTLRRDKGYKSNHHGARYSACVDEKGSLVGHLLVSPTYSMYNSTIKGCNYFVGDDEAVSRF
ncbi:PREDICTED: high-affinity choline transporter 1-like [Ceratosolen solmsi marchali]|uniref:High-affinity choline transporter 1-like n=1 Tax=Ceratosolen solmsi marchali TaxID=326594 RepID=A0AAJ7DX24_9HYME|nr:PREDICTED: high-affinity choline transporter 1-like [Ceratosolen solmsi marchali]